MKQNHSKYVKSSTKAILAAAVLAGSIAPYSVQASTGITNATEATTAINKLDPTKGMDYVKAVKDINDAVTSKKLVLTTSIKVSLLYHTQAIAVVEAIETLIDNSGDISAITTKIGLDAITAEITPLKLSYTKLSETARGFVKNYSKLTDLETAVKNRATAIQYEVYLVDFRLAMAQLPTKTVDLAAVTTGAAFTELPPYQKYSTGDVANIVAARAEHNKLATTFQAIVKTELAKITKHETQVNYQKALEALIDTEQATAFTKRVNDLNLNTSAPNYVTQVGNLNGELATLSSGAAALISSSTKVSLTYHTQAAAVVTAIKGLLEGYTVAIIEAANQETLNTIKSNVDAVRGNYSKLGTTARSYVGNISNLQALESAITARQNYFNNVGALSGWTAAFDKITGLTPIDFTGVTGINFNSAPNKYITPQINYIKNANTEYTKLTSTLKQLVAESQSTLLANLVAANTRQEQLQAEATKLAPWIAAYALIKDVGVISFDDVTAATFTKDTLQYTEQQLLDIKAARKQYDALMSNHPTLEKLVPREDVKKLQNHETAAATQAGLQTNATDLKDWIAAYALIKGVDVISFDGVTAATFTKDTPQYIDQQLLDIEAANGEYGELGETFKALVPPADVQKLEYHVKAAADQKDLQTNATSLVAWNGAYAKLKDVVEISFGVTPLTFTKDTQQYSTPDLANIEEAKKQYDALNTTLQGKLPIEDRYKLNRLVTAAAKQNKLQKDATSLAAWIAAYDKIKGVPVIYFTGVTAVTIGDVTTKYSSPDLANIAAAKTQYEALDSTPTLKQLVPTADVATLNNHVAAAAAQKDLQTNATSLAAWIAAYKKINYDPLDFSSVTAATYTAAPKYSTQDVANIEEAKTQYDALNSNLTLLVPDADSEKLQAHEVAVAKQAALKTAYEALEAEKTAFNNKYAELVKINDGKARGITSATTLAEFKAAGFVKYTTTGDTALISEVRTLYSKLSPLALDAVTGAQFQLIVDHEKAVEQQTRLENELANEAQTANQTLADAFIGKVAALAALPIESNATAYAATVDTLTVDFMDLDDAVQALIPQETKTALANHEAAALVVTKIAAITPISAVEAIVATDDVAQSTLDTAKVIAEAARNSYTPLTLAQKNLVFNYANLTALETAITTKQNEITRATALKPFNEAFADLPKLDVVAAVNTLKWDATLTVDGIKALYYSDVAAAAITTADAAYVKLTSAQKTAAVEDNYRDLTTHKGYYNKQQKLIAEIAAYEAVKHEITTFESDVARLGEPKVFTDNITTLIGLTVDEVYTTPETATIEGLITTYTNFGDNKKFITPSTDTAYLDHTTALVKQKRLELNDRLGKVGALNTKIKGWDITLVTSFDTFKIEIDDAKALYNTLILEEQNKIEAANKTKLDNYAAAIVVIKAISELDPAYATQTTSDAVTLFIASADTIKLNYGNLTSAQQRIVSQTVENQTKLLDYITQAHAKRKQLLIEETLTDWEDAYSKISGLNEHKYPLAGTDFNYFTTPDVALLIETARTEYNELNAMADKDFVNAVDATHLLKLVALEAVVTKKLDIDAETAAFKAAIAFLNGVTLIDYSQYTVDNYKTSPDASYVDFENFVKNIDTALKAYEENIAKDPTYYRESIAKEKENLDDFKADVTKYAQLKAQDENSVAIALELKPWTDLLTNLQAITLKGYATTIDAANVGTAGFEAYTTELELPTISNARLAYNALGTVAGIDVKTYVKDTDLTKLEALEADVKAYNNALTANQLAGKEKVITDLVAAIDALVVADPTFVTSVDTVQLQYMNMPELTKAEFNRTKAESATKLSNYRAIAVVAAKVKPLESVEQINATKTLEALDTIDDKVKVVRSSYDALTDPQKALYTSGDTALIALETAITTQRTKLQNAKAIEVWTTNYKKLPPVIDFTGKTYADLEAMKANLYSSADVAVVELLRRTYSEVYGPEVQALVTSADVVQLELVEVAVAKQKELQEEADIQPTIAAWKYAFGKLPETVATFDTVTVENFKGAPKYTPDEIGYIKDARTELTALATNDAALAFISKEAIKLLEDHEVAVLAQEALQSAFDAADAAKLLAEFKGKLAALATEDTAYITKYEELSAGYTKYKGQLTTTEDTSYVDHGAAITVIKAITKALTDNPLTSADTVTKVEGVLTALDTVVNQYNNLENATQKSYVKNYTTLTDAIGAAGTKKDQLTQTEAIATWTEAYKNLPELLNFDKETYETIGKAIKYNSKEITAIKELRTIIFDNYTKTVQGYVNEAEYNNFEKYEAAVERQELLEDQELKADTNLSKLDAWNKLYAELPGIIDMSGLTWENYETYTPGKYADGIETTIDSARVELERIQKIPDANIFLEADEVDKFEELEKSVDTYLAVKAIVDSLAGWKEAYKALPTVINVTGLTKENFKDFKYSYSDNVFTLIQAAENEYQDLADDKKTYFEQDYNKIKDLKESVETYFTIKLFVDEVSGWNTAYAALPAEVIDTSELTVANFGTYNFTTYTDTDIEQKIQTAQAMLDDVARESVEEEELEKFEALKLSVKKYLEIKELVEGLAEWVVAYKNLPVVTMDAANINVSNIGGVKYPENIESLIQAAEAEYGKLTTDEKTHVTPEQLDKIAKLNAFVTQYKAVQGVVGRLTAWNIAYDALPDVTHPAGITVDTFNSITYPDNLQTLIDDAEDVYRNLTTGDQAYVTREKLEKIEASKTKYSQVKAVIDELADWTLAYDALPTLLATDDLTVDNFAEFKGEYAEDAESLIATARQVYAEELGEMAQAEVDATEYGMLDTLSTSVANYRQVKAAVGKQNQEAAAKELIDDIITMTPDTIEDAIDLMAQFNSLSPEAKALFSTSQKVNLVYSFDAAQTVQLIKALPTVEAINLVTTTGDLEPLQTQVQAARTKYIAISSTARSYVTNIDDLIAAENAVKAKAQTIANDSFLISWNAAIIDLEGIDVLGFTNMDIDQFATEARRYEGDKEIIIITAARTQYNALSTTLKAVVSPTDGYIKLVALEADVKAQTVLEGQVAVTNVATYTGKVNSLTGAEGDFVEQVAVLNAQYSAISSKLSSATKVRVVYLTQAVAVIEKINALSIAEEADATAIAAYKAAVADARLSYLKASSTASSFVKNISVLEEHEIEAKNL